jgi:hypothetical protein
MPCPSNLSPRDGEAGAELLRLHLRAAGQRLP